MRSHRRVRDQSGSCVLVRGVDPAGWGVLTPWKYVGWAEYVLTPPPPKNVTLFHLTLLLDNSGSFASPRMKHERHLGQKWKVKLIVRGAYRLSRTGIVERLEIIDVGRNLKQFDGFTWPDWPWPPYFTTYLCHWFLTDILGAEMANDCDIASGFPTVYSRHDTPALFLLLASIQSISGTDSASQVLLFEARSVQAPPSPRDHVTNKHKLLLRRERKKTTRQKFLHDSSTQRLRRFSLLAGSWKWPPEVTWGHAKTGRFYTLLVA